MASIVAIEKVGKEHLIAASSHGHFALIQWKRVVAASATSAFATAASASRTAPTVVSVWLSYAALSDQQVPEDVRKDPSVMGIQNIQVGQTMSSGVGEDTAVGKKIHSSHKVVGCEQLCGRFSISWITRCGWVLSVVLDATPSKEWKAYRVRRQKPTVIYHSNIVETRLATGAIARTKKEWSLPTKPVATDANSQFVCWQKVAPVTRILSHHDKRVLDDQPSIIRDVKESNQLFLLIKTTSGEVQPNPIALPRKRGLPNVVAVEPVNQNWAVVATSTGRLCVVDIA